MPTAYMKWMKCSKKYSRCSI